MVIHVVYDFYHHDSLKMRRLQSCHYWLQYREIGDSYHSNITITVRKRCCPFNNIIAVLLLLASVQTIPGTFGFADSSWIRNYYDIAVPYIFIDIACFDRVVEKHGLKLHGYTIHRLNRLSIG